MSPALYKFDNIRNHRYISEHLFSWENSGPIEATRTTKLIDKFMFDEADCDLLILESVGKYNPYDDMYDPNLGYFSICLCVSKSIPKDVDCRDAYYTISEFRDDAYFRIEKIEQPCYSQFDYILHRAISSVDTSKITEYDMIPLDTCLQLKAQTSYQHAHSYGNEYEVFYITHILLEYKKGDYDYRDEIICILKKEMENAYSKLNELKNKFKSSPKIPILGSSIQINKRNGKIVNFKGNHITVRFGDGFSKNFNLVYCIQKSLIKCSDDKLCEKLNLFKEIQDVKQEYAIAKERYTFINMFHINSNMMQKICFEYKFENTIHHDTIDEYISKYKENPYDSQFHYKPLERNTDSYAIFAPFI